MRAVILAGGKGIRLAPLTEVIPKPLVPIGGMPVMEIVVRQLKNHGFQRITLAVGYMADLIRAYFQDGSRWGMKIDYSLETSPLGTAGPLSLIEDLRETFLVMNADVVTNLNYTSLIKFHRVHGGVATIGSYQKEVKIDLGVIVEDGEFSIKDYIEKPLTHHRVSMGVYVFEPQVFKWITAGQYLDLPDLLRMLLAASQPVKFYPFDGYWLDIGRHDDYSQAAEEFDQMKGALLGNESRQLPPPGQVQRNSTLG
ncbi:MAG: nucleotidyltransferase family protein [Deltaproteobacteria bacterium]|nr:nucleotidyltransferase family protein [Deltaproteobacteria bacterium]